MLVLIVEGVVGESGEDCEEQGDAAYDDAAMIDSHHPVLRHAFQLLWGTWAS